MALVSEYTTDAAMGADGADLAYAARAGQQAVFGLLIGHHQRAGFNMCFQLMGERRDAEDMTQEAFVCA